MAYGRLSNLLMGSPQYMSPPPDGGLMSALGQYMPSSPMGGGMGQGAFPQAPQAMQMPASSGGGFDLFSPENALPIAGALIGANSNAEGIGNALILGGGLYGKNKERNRTKELLSKIDPQMAAFADAGAPLDKLWAAALRKKGMDGETTYGKTPIYGTDPETGKTVLGVVGDDGNFKKIDTGNFDVSTGVEKVDLGTHWGLLDKRSGNFIGTMQKDVAGEAREKAIGTGIGEATVDYQSIASKLPGLRAVVGELKQLANEATYTKGGQLWDEIRKQTGAEPREAAVARTKYIAMVRNQIFPILRDTFGAQFTKAEGDALLTTLGDPDLAPVQKQEVLEAFIAQKERDVAALAAQTNQTPPAPPPASAPAPTADYKKRYGLD